jgi:ubiquinone biosynthesis protein
MEFISGHAVNDVETMRTEGVDPSALSERISVLIFEQVLVHGFFHGDPHPGNMTLLPGGVLGLYDFGMMGELSTSFRASIANLLAGLSTRDHRQVMNSLLEMSEEGSVGDPDAMLRGIESFSTRHLGESISKVRLTVVFNALLELLQTHHLRMKGAFYLGIKALTQIEAVGLELNPSLNFVEIGRPYAEKIILSRYTPGHIAEILKRLATESVGFLEVLPDDFHRFWIRLRRGEVSIPIEHKIDPKGFEPIRTTVDSVANRLANSILAASVLICSSIIIHSRIPPRIWDIPILGLVGLICGALMTFRLVMSIWKHGGL